MKIISKEFNHGEYIPTKFTCNGENINPELEFVDVPENTKSLVLIFDDPDVPEVLREDRNFDHWILFNIPADTRKIEENSKVGISEKILVKVWNISDLVHQTQFTDIFSDFMLWAKN